MLRARKTTKRPSCCSSRNSLFGDGKKKRDDEGFSVKSVKPESGFLPARAPVKNPINNEIKPGKNKKGKKHSKQNKKDTKLFMEGSSSSGSTS
uniref:Ovule protein n=1 Tax=Rhabditophanes sp. KR3021 TaxID=114890 RepID=A0AC35TRK7_9BILA